MLYRLKYAGVTVLAGSKVETRRTVEDIATIT